MPANNGLEKLAQTNFYGKDGTLSLENARAIYKWYLQNGYITGNLRKPTYDKFIEYVRSKMRLVPGAKTVKASLNQVLNEEAGGKYKGFLLQAKDEDIRDISPDKRAFNTLVLNPIEEAFLTEKYGKQRVKEYKAAVGRDKKAMGAFNQFLAEKLGITFDMGHFQPSASSKGGVYGERGTSPEPSSFNRLQGAQPRSNQQAFAETGRSFSKIQDFYNWDLETKNLGVLGAKGLTPADFLAIERGADPNQVLLKRQQAIDSGLDIGDGKNYTEDILRAYFGDEDIDRSWKHATESLSREKMRTGINPATNKPVPAQEKVDTALLERPNERARRTSIAKKVGQHVHQAFVDSANQGFRLVMSNGSLRWQRPNQNQRPVRRSQAISTSTSLGAAFSSASPYDSRELVQMQEDRINSSNPFVVKDGQIYDSPMIRLVD